MNNTEEADEVLIGRYAHGDAAAFDQLYRRHEFWVWRYLERNVFDQATSDELLQDVWLALARNAVGFEPGMRFRTRLFTLAHDRMAVLLRARASKGAPATTPARPAVSEDPASALARAIGQLPRDQREALLLQLEGQLSVGHIAETTESTVDAVEGRLNTAKLKLLELLNAKGHVPPNPDPLSEVDSLYRRLSALDPGRPGEWVRRKVQAYAAQQAAERALRANATTKANSGSATSRIISAPIAEKKAARKPWLLPAALGAIAAVALVGFLIFRSTRSEMPQEALAPAPVSQPEPATPEVAQVPATPSESVSPAPPSTSSQPSAPAPVSAPSAARQSPAPTSVARTPAGPSPSTPPAPVVSHRSAGAPAAQSPTRARVARQSAAAVQSSPTSGDRAETTAQAPRSTPPADPAPASSNATEASTGKQTSSAPQPGITAAATQPTPTSATSAATSTPPDKLWVAAKSGDMTGLQAALASSPDVNALDAKGHSALVLAIQNNHLHAVQALLAHGANPNTPDARGYTPMRVARMRYNVEILNALENKSPH
jgi:RNA polymerase sigma factor (sigma-70 family)